MEQITPSGPRRRRVRRSADQWAALIAAQAKSGLSIAAFCREHGLSASGFYQWRGRLGADLVTSPAGRGGFVRLRMSRGSWCDAGSSAGVHAPGGVDSGPDRMGANPGPVVVRFIGGVQLHVEGDRLGEVLAWLCDRGVDRQRS